MLKQWHNFYGKLRQHEGFHFAFDSLVVFAGTGVISVLFVLFHAVVSRLMGTAEYAQFVALIALLNVLNVPSLVVSTTMARYVAEFVHRNDTGTWRLLVRRGLKLTTPIALLILTVWCLAAPWLRAELKAPSVAAVIMVGLCAFIGLFCPILGGALQGSRRFGWGAASGIGTAAFRLAAGAVLAALGLGIAWLLGSVAASILLGLLIAWWPLRRAWHASASSEVTALPPARAIQGYFWNVLIAQTALFLLINADMILMARYLDAGTLGAYGKAAQLSRIVFYLPMPLAAAMFPRAVTSSNPRLILGPVLFTLAICLGAALFLTLFPDLVLRLIFGGAATGPLYIELTRWYAWAAIPLALINLLAPYLWARHETVRVLWLVPACLLYLAGLFVFHHSPQQLIACVLAGGLLALAALAWPTLHLLRADARTAAGPQGA
jgi:O-antigen/teichoic acid export membrane protein